MFDSYDSIMAGFKKTQERLQKLITKRNQGIDRKRGAIMTLEESISIDQKEVALAKNAEKKIAEITGN